MYQRLGRRGESEAIVASLEQRQSRGDVRAGTNLAFAHAVLGRQDAEFSALDSIQWEIPVLIGLRADPLRAELRSDPRYPRLLQKLGVERQLTVRRVFLAPAAATTRALSGADVLASRFTLSHCVQSI